MPVQTVRTLAARYAPELTALTIFIGFLALRLPFRSEFLVNWDAVNFALGTQWFDLEHHQPHPPGYVGYVALGWLLNHLTGEANTSLTLLSAVSGAVAPVGLYLLASHFIPRRYAAITAVIFGLSPVVWYYSLVALSYSVELALALFFLWAGYQARVRVSMRYLLLATALLVLLGAIRQSGGLFLTPLWLYLAWPFPWRSRLGAAVVLVAGDLMWLVPLLWLAGDPTAYLRASAALASLAVAPTSVFALNPLGLAQNMGLVALGLLVGVNLGIVIIALAYVRRTRPLAMLTREDRLVFLLWLGPALVTYVLVHTGQLGYVLLILPAGFIWAGMALTTLASQGQGARILAAARRGGARISRAATMGLAGLFAAANVGGFLLVPLAVYPLVHPTEKNVIQSLSDALSDSKPLFRITANEEGEGLAQRVRQYHLKLNDMHWNQLIDLVRHYDPNTTAILAVPDGAGSFRHLTYYLPEYRIYGLGKDLEASFGHMFTAYEGTSDYSVEGLQTASKALVLPHGVSRLVIPDKSIATMFEAPATRSAVELASGTRVIVAAVPAGAHLRFVDTKDGDSRIILAEPPKAPVEPATGR